MKLALVVVAACGAAPPPPPAAPPPAKEVQLNQPGVLVKVEDSTAAGYVTIVDFWSESCGACVEVHARVAAGIADQPKTILRKVDVGDGFTEVAHAYDIAALPHYNVYDTRRRLRFILVGNDCLRAPELAKQLLGEPP
ncbi:MAG TPA: thioredoxin domain-containing protein [Kofleriaceae bacterium]|nr:thioredoxin domain-containing protein [Kofleriaceae bacterium]